MNSVFYYVKKYVQEVWLAKSDQFAGPSKVISDQHRFVCRMQIKVIVLWFFGGTVDTEEHIQNIYTSDDTSFILYPAAHKHLYCGSGPLLHCLFLSRGGGGGGIKSDCGKSEPPLCCLCDDSDDAVL
jgi:hypothetical protein